MERDNNIEWYDFGDEDLLNNDIVNPLDKAFIFTKTGIPLLYGKSTYRLIEKILSGEILEELSKDDKIVFQSIDDEEIDKLFK